MFGTLRKHQKWLWAVLVVLMSISLVALFTNSDLSGSRGGGSRARRDWGSINGRPIEDGEYRDAWNEIRIASYLHSGKWPANDEASSRRMENETISRVFILHKLKEMDIKASEKAVALMVMQDLREVPYSTLAEILQPNNLTLADYERYVQNETSLRQLIAAATVSARLVNPGEAESIWRKENQELLGQLACFWTSNYLSKVVITNGAVTTFYSNMVNRLYRLPERLTLSYVEFNASNYLADADSKIAKATNLNEIISDFYSRGRGGTNAWVDTNGVPLAEAAAKDKIREQMRQSEALLAARRAATDFGTELINRPDPNQITNLAFLAAQRQFAVHFTKPFDSGTNGLEEFDQEEVGLSRSDEGPRQTLRGVVRAKAFSLTDVRPVLFNPIPGKQAVYIIARRGRVPSEIQPLDKILDKVTADYRSRMAFELSRRAGLAFHTNLTNGLTMKKSFEELCVAEKVPILELPPFSPVTQSLTNIDPRINLRELQELTHRLELGSVLPFIQPGMEGGYIFYAKARPPVDTTKLAAELPEFVNRLRVFRQNEAFQQWFHKQAEQARLAAPKHEGVGAAN